MSPAATKKKPSNKTTARYPFEILKPDEVTDLREIWTQDLANYWPAIHQIARARKQLARDVSEEVWRGTFSHNLMWGPKGRGRTDG